MDADKANELAEMFLYLEWLEGAHTEEMSQYSGRDMSETFLVLASDSTTCWGGTYREAVKAAMEHDAKLFDPKTREESN